MKAMKTAAVASVALALAIGLMSPAAAQAPEKKSIALGVGGKGLLYYLPLTIAEQLGYFKEQGLDVTINDFRGGSQSLKALVGGSVDVVTGAYEHTIRMQAKGQDIRAVIELGRFPRHGAGGQEGEGRAGQVLQGPEGLQDRRDGARLLDQLLRQVLIVKEGLKPEDISIIGWAPVRARSRRSRRARSTRSSNLDPVITKLSQDGDIVILADSRTEEGNIKLFGGNNPAAVVYLKKRFHREESGDHAARRQRALQGAQVAGEGDAGRRRQDRAGGTSTSATGRSISPPSRRRLRCTRVTGVIPRARA